MCVNNVRQAVHLAAPTTARSARAFFAFSTQKSPSVLAFLGVALNVKTGVAYRQYTSTPPFQDETLRNIHVTTLLNKQRPFFHELSYLG